MKNISLVIVSLCALGVSGCGETVALQKEYVSSRDNCQQFAEVKAEWLQSRGVEMDERQRNAKLVEMFNDCMRSKNWDLGGEKPKSDEKKPEAPSEKPKEQPAAEKDTTLVNRGVGIGVGPTYALEEQEVEGAGSGVSRAQAAPVPQTAQPAAAEGAVVAPMVVPAPQQAAPVPQAYPPSPNIMPPGVMILPVPVVPYWGGAVPAQPPAVAPASAAPVANAPVAPPAPPTLSAPATAAPVAPVSTQPVAEPARPPGELSPDAEQKIRRILNESE